MDRRNGRTLLDDTELLKAAIEGTTNVQGHTEYLVRVQRGPLSEHSWVVRRRYNDFVILHGALQVAQADLPLPPKKMFGNMDREFVSIRQQGLQNYLNVVLSHPTLAASLAVKRFLDPVNYLQNFQEKTLQHVFMMFRSEPTWNVVEAIPEMGWRIRRHYFLAKQQAEPTQEYIMSWCDYGPDLCLGEKEINSVMKFLTNINHPYICSPVMASSDKNGVVIIYKFNAEGSLRDYVYGSKPKMPYLKKFRRSNKTPWTINVGNIRHYGRQILEALIFIHKKGIPFGHLQMGNVLLEDGTCRLVGLENAFFGLPSYYREFATRLRRVKTLQSLDIYSFGHIIYELVFGERLNSATCDHYPLTCPPEIKSVLESILTTEACQGGLPSAEDLLTHPLFSSTNRVHSEKVAFKTSSQVREWMKAVQIKVESRLIQDQKLLRQSQRLIRAQAILTDENGSAKRNSLRLRKVKENSLEAQSSNSEAGTENGSISIPTPPPLPQSSSSTDVGGAVSAKTAADVVPAEATKSAQFKTLLTSPDSSGYSSGMTPSPSDLSSSRSDLLGAIQNFDKTKLNKTMIADHSAPRI